MAGDELNGTVFTYTVNEHAYHPNYPPPYVVALVELDEQPGLRVVTNIVGCEPHEVTIGMSVRSQDGVFVPREPMSAT